MKSSSSEMMINFDAMDFSECRPKEATFVLRVDVYNYTVVVRDRIHRSLHWKKKPSTSSVEASRNGNLV